MKRSLDIPDFLYEKLQESAHKKGLTVAALIKLACSDYLEREERKNNKN